MASVICTQNLKTFYTFFGKTFSQLKPLFSKGYKNSEQFGGPKNARVLFEMTAKQSSNVFI